MKINVFGRIRPSRSVAALVLSAILSISSAQAVTILVDVSDLSAVKFTASNDLSLIGFSELLSFGFSLNNFFSANTSAFSSKPVVSSNLTNVLGGQLFNRAQTGNSSTNDLNIYGSAGGTYMMNTVTQALSGEMIIDLSSLSGIMKGVGASGNIFYDYDPFTGQDFGSWEIVASTSAPEPGTLALIALGLMGFGLNRRKRLH